jgi:hypothetical protein
MAQYILRRLVFLIPTLVLVTILVFSIIRLLPGNIVVLMLSEQGYTSDRAQLERMLGLDRPFYEQYLTYIGHVLQGDLGVSAADFERLAHGHLRCPTRGGTRVMQEEVDPQLTGAEVDPPRREVSHRWRSGFLRRIRRGRGRSRRTSATLLRTGKEQFHVIVESQRCESLQLRATQHDSHHGWRQLLHTSHRQPTALQLMPDTRDSRFVTHAQASA